MTVVPALTSACLAARWLLAMTTLSTVPALVLTGRSRL